MESLSGRVVLGRYRVVAPLARGGMGIIYLGRLEGAAGFAKPVVIKTVIPDTKDDRSAQLFVREARILSNLQHPAIVGVLDFGEAEGEYVMVLEYVHGFHLGTWARYVQDARGTMAVEHAVEVMLPVLDALEFAHRMERGDGTPLGIVHRDISPANILLDHLGNVKLHDFGIARMADDEFKTQDGTFRGTLSFTAPETLQGMSASPKSDLYACGVVIYQLIAGSNPFRGQQPSETLHRVVTHVPPGLSSLRPEVGQALEAAIAKALEKDPDNRFESAGAFAAALRAARTWREQDAVADLQSVIHDDFMGPDMASRMSLETLQSRDAAWRAAQPTGQRSPLSSSPPPPRRSSAEQLTQRVAHVPYNAEPGATIQALPSSALLELARAGAASAAGDGQRPVAADPVPVAVEAGPRKKSGLVWAGAATLVALAAAGASYPLWRPKSPEPPPRFLLIEKQADADETAAAPSAGQVEPTASATAPIALSALPLASAKAVAGRVEAPASGSTITAAFQRQRGRVEGCFRAHPEEAEQQRQVTIRFQIEASGVVRSADLQPASLSGSPLGGCILGIARATRFPVGEAPITFSIPITARKAGQ
jgi:eukaryotic-like serine/threonine-protein kinase